MMKGGIQLVLPCILLLLVGVRGQVPGFSLRGVSYPNHGLVLISDVGDAAVAGDSTLDCVSDNTNCCTSGFRGEYYFPNNDKVPIQAEIGDGGYFRGRAADRIRLSRRGGTTTGLFRCQIGTVANPNGENLYIGVYDESSGSPTVTNVVYDDTEGRFTCTSRGGPATIVTWRRNCMVLPNSADYQQLQTVTSAMTAEYSNTLTIASGVTDREGVYTCAVTNLRGFNTFSAGLGDDYSPTLPVTISITEGSSPVVGESYTLTCFHTTASGVSTTPVSFQWIGPDGSTLGSTTNTLTLDSLSGNDRGEYSCLVTVGSGANERAGCGVWMVDPPVTVTVSDGTVMAGGSHTLICSVNGAPTATGSTMTYSWFKGDTILTGCNTSQCMISEAEVDDAGDDYICRVTVSSSGMVIATNTGTGSLRVTLPPPDVVLRAQTLGSFYVGLDFSMRCDAEIIGPLTGVTADIVWSRGSNELTSDDRITVGSVIVDTPGVEWRRSVMFNPLSSVDSGSYTCTATIRPMMANAFVTNGMGTKTQPMSVITPTLAVSVSDITSRVLDISPYNSFSLTCTATSRVGGVATALTKTLQWMRSINSSDAVELTNSDTGVSITHSNLDEAISTSMINVVASTAGDHSYTCLVSLDVSPATDDIDGEDSTTIPVLGSAQPNPPTGLMNISISHDRVTIQWTVSSIAYDPETYIVQYGTTSDSLTSSSSTVSSGNDITRTNFMLSVELTGLTLDTRYFYRVMATNTASPGSTLSAGPPATFTTSGLPPGPPTELGQTKLTSTSYMFSWIVPDVTNGVLTGHVMTCDPQVDGLGNITQSVGGDDMMATLSGLENGVTYMCSVKAQNNAGSSPASDPVTITTDEAVPTASVLSGSFMLNRIPTSGTSITVSWSAPNLMDRNGVITSYTVTCNSTGVTNVSMTYTEAETNTLGGLRPATTYSCDIFANNSAGMGPRESSTVRTSEDAPSAPVNVMAMIVDGAPGNITISWSSPSEPNGVIVHYDIMCTSALGEDVNGRRVGNIMNSISLTGLTPATRYTCTVTASTMLDGPPGMVDIITLPAPPTIAEVTERTSSSLTVSWTYNNPPSDAIISRYNIYVDGKLAGTTTGDETQYIITGLDSFTNYSIQVSAQNDNEGLRSERVTAMTDEGLSEAVRCGSRWTDDDNGAMIVTWEEPENTNGVVLNYVVIIMEYSGDSEPLLTVTVDASDRSFAIPTTNLTLNAGVPYNVSIIVNNSAGIGEQCVSVDFTDERAPPADILKGLTLTRSNDNREIDITWDVLPLDKAMGFVTLTITYSPGSEERRKRQTSSSMNVCSSSPCEDVSYESGSAKITGLEPSGDYQVSVVPTNGESETGTAVTMESQGMMPSGGGVSLGIIVGAIVGALFVIVIIIVVIIIVVCCCKRSKEGKYAPSYYDDDVPMKGLDSKERSPTPIDDPGMPSPVVSPELTIVDRLRPIQVVAFSDHVRAMHNDRDKGFEKEYESVNSDPNASYDVAKLNKSKNRFANIFPYDFSRVKLQEIPGVDGSEYVNASYIDGYGRPDAYIAAQGPMPNTIGDFWRMVFEHRLSTIVMLTKCTEAGKRKCEQYWSDNVNEVYTPPNTSLLVVLTEQMPFADYEIKKFSVSDNSQPGSPPLNVTHYHFLGWPDHGVPKFATSLIGFIRRVRSSYNKSGPPMLVHCSAGVGRTGTFILLDSMLERMRNEDSVNVYEFLRNMRAKRVFMVQTQAQYVFIHDALDELITCGETDVAAHNLRMKISALHKVVPGSSHKKFNEQFALLNEVSRKPNDSDCSDGLQHYNHTKNRYENKVPYNINRVRLRPNGVTGGEYINASFIDGYKHRNTYIAAQAPLESTVSDFWRMIWEFKSKAIIMLCDTRENGEETSYMYWPTGEDIPVTYGKLIVTLQSEEQTGELVTRKFEIKDDKSQASSLGGPSKTQSFVVTLFHYPQWPEKGRPNDVTLLLQMIESLNVVQRNTGNKPITVMCNDGMSRTGTFICIHAQQERIKTEGMVDFFQFIKSSRIHRPQLVSELEHYIFCHDALADYLDSFDNYANFKDLGAPSSV